MSGGGGAFAVLLGAALVIGLVAQRLRIPYTVALVVTGAIASATHRVDLPFEFGPDVLFVFLPALIFEGAWNIDLRSLQRTWLPVVLLAGPGVAITVGCVVLAVWASGSLLPIEGLVLGSIVAATDPVAVIAIFRALNVPADMRTIVEGESIANDGVSVALYGSALALALGSHATFSLAGVAVSAAAAIVGGIAVGGVSALVVLLLAKNTQDRTVELTATLLLAYGSYALAQAIDVSGIFATASAALSLRIFDRRIESITDHDFVDRFWAVIALLANSLVFLSMGLTIEIGRIAHEPKLIAVTLLAVLVARIVLAYGFVPAAGGENRGHRFVVGLAGMRGGLSLALALSLPDSLPYRPQIIDAVFAVVLVTLVVQGLTIEPYLRRWRRPH